MLKDYLNRTLKIQGKLGIVINVLASKAPILKVEIIYQKDYTHFKDLKAYKSGFNLSFINNNTKPKIFN